MNGSPPPCFHIPLPSENRRSLMVMRFVLHHLNSCILKCQCDTLMEFAVREKLTTNNMKEVLIAYSNKCEKLSK